MLNRTQAPQIHDAVEFELTLKPYKKFSLDNNVPVYTIDAGAEEVLQIEFVFFAGNWYEEKNIVAATANFMLKNGTKNKSAFAINEHFEFYGSYLNRSCQNETATFSLHCLSKHLPELLPVMAEILSESIFPENELQIIKQNLKQRLEVNLKKCDFVANRLIDEYVFGKNHPYGKYTTAEDYDNLQREELVNFYDRFYKSGKCMLFAAGKLPADIEFQLNKAFGNLSFNQNNLPEIVHALQPSSQKKINIINDEHGVQGAVRLGSSFPNRHHPDFIKCQVLNTVFGGYFGSRLMSNIREEKGYTYGIHSHFENHIQSSAWMISTEAGRDVCEASINETYKEMKRLREEIIDEDELLLVKNYLIGSILGDLDGPFQIIARWKNYIINNLTEDFFYNNIKTIKTITAKELQQLAQKYLIEENFYELTVV